MSGKVSVIIVNWNGERFLERCLAALMAQTVAPHEIILLDNASSDGSLGIARRFPSVRLMVQDQNTGFARGNNLAIAAASAESEWVALINPDAFAEPRWLEALLAEAESNPGFDVLGSKLVNAADPTVLDGAGDAYHVSGLVWRMGHGMRLTRHELIEPVRADITTSHSTRPSKDASQVAGYESADALSNSLIDDDGISTSSMRTDLNANNSLGQESPVGASLLANGSRQQAGSYKDNAANGLSRLSIASLSKTIHEPREIFSPCAAAALYRRSAMREIGGFDEDYFCYVEDVDLGFRLRLAGYRCLYVPQSVAHHVGSGTTGGQDSDFAIYHGHRNLMWTYVKDMPGLLFWLLLPLHVALNLASIIWFVLRGRGGVIWRAKHDALTGLPKMWRKRQHIQKTRVASIGEVWRVLDKRLFRR